MKPEWVVGLRVQRGGVQELRQYNVGGKDEQEAIKNARQFEPVSTVAFVRECTK